jgi:hypothetical protein
MSNITELCVSDLARSGLTVEDIEGGRELTRQEIKSLLGTDSLPKAEGGILIPYYDLTGEPIQDNTRDFVRVRLVGRVNDDVARYLSRGATSAHLYIPPQLATALKGKNYIIITEGEKKAIKGCMMGFPTVAIAGVHMGYDPADKSKLLSELHELLTGLIGAQAIDTALVIFDSNGYPTGEKKLPSDKAAKSEYTKIKGGLHVRNVAVFTECVKLAATIKTEISGLKVGHGWFEPVVQSASISNSNNTVSLFNTVTHQGLDDILATNSNGHAVVSDVINRLSDKAVAGTGKGGYIPLGTTGGGGVSVFWSIPQNSLISISSEKLGSPALLAGYVGLSWLERKYPIYKQDGTVSIDTTRASMELASACAPKGAFVVSNRVFGVGTWHHHNSIIVNTRDGVYCEGECLERHDANRREFYVTSGDSAAPAHRTVTDAEYAEVIAKILTDLSTWNYKELKTSGPKMMLGWLIESIMLGALKQRPSIWLVAPRGSGKSSLALYMRNCLGDYAYYSPLGSETTAAGIRTKLQQGAFPCILDELEVDKAHEDYRTKAAMDNTLGLLRGAYSAEGSFTKSNASQQSVDYKITSSFLCVSISDPVLDPADLTRVVKVELSPVKAGGRPPESLNAEQSSILYWGTIQRGKKLLSLLNKFAEHWFPIAIGGDSREGDTYGTLICSYMAACDMNESHIADVIRTILPDAKYQMDDVRESSQQHDIVLTRIMTSAIDVQHTELDSGGSTRVYSEKTSIGRVIWLANRERMTGNHDGEYSQTLENVGIKIGLHNEREYLVVRNTHQGLAAALGDRKHDGSWVGGLSNIPGVERGVKMRFGLDRKSGTTPRCTLVPLDYLNLQCEASCISMSDISEEELRTLN